MIRSLRTITFLLCTLFVGHATVAQDDIQAEAQAKLLDMANYLASAPRFQVDLRTGYDTVQEDGQKIEFGERRQLSVERPSYLLSEAQEGIGRGELVLFDGKWITVSDPKAKVYARAPQPGDLDTTLKYFVGDLGMRLPLAVMLMSQFPQELQQRVLDLALVEETDVLGEPTAHIAGRTDSVDFQVWISTGREPLPLRIVLTYREAAGEPQFWANFSNWKMNPSFMRNAFEFEPAAGAQQLPLAAQFKPGVVDSADNASSTAPSQGDQ